MTSRTFFVAGLFAAALGSGCAEPAAGQAAAPGSSAASPVALVELDGVILARVRGTAGFPAARRGREIVGRIRDLAKDPAFDSTTLRTVESELGTEILAGERRILVLTEADAELEGINRVQVAAITVKSIREAIPRYRAAREGDALFSGAWRAIAALGVFWIVTLLVRRLARRIDQPFAEKLHRRVGADTGALKEVVRVEYTLEIARGAVAALRWIVVLGAGYLALVYAFDQLPWTRGIARRLRELVLGPLIGLAQGFVDRIPDLLFLLVLVLMVRGVLRLLKSFFDSVGAGSIRLGDFEPEWALPTLGLVRVGVLGLAIIVAYPYIPGSETEAFKGLSIFLGVLFSLGSTSAIANVVAGYSMIYRRSFREGDRVAIGDVVGDVDRLRMQVTHIRTPKNEEVVIPNSSVASRDIRNYSALARRQGLILYTTVGIGYETPWRQVEAMLKTAAERTEGLLQMPPPFVLIKQLGDFAVTYELNVHTADAQAMQRTYSLLHQQILDVFNEFGIQIMTPAYEGDPEQPKIVPPEAWFTPPAKPAGASPPAGESKG